MNLQTIFQGKVWIYLLVLVTFGLAIVVGASYLILPSLYAPLFVLVGAVGCATVILCLRKPVWALYFAIFVVLLPTSLIPAEYNSYLNRAATIFAFLVWVLGAIEKKRKIIVNLPMILMICFIAWSVITYTWAKYQEDASYAIQTYILRLILFIILISNEIKTRKDLEWLMNTIALSGLLVILVSLFSIASQGYVSGTRFKVLDVNENELGIKLLISLPGVFWWALRPSRLASSIKKPLAGLYLLASIGLTGLSGSRGSAISIGIALLIFLFWKPTCMWGVFAVIGVGIALIVAPSIFSTTIERFLVAEGDTALGGREYLWPAAWNMIKDHIITGVGIGNSQFEVIPYLVHIGARWVSYESEPLHNPILVIWAETGLIGLLVYLGIPVCAVMSFILEFLKQLKIKNSYLIPYFVLIGAMFIGFIASWVKGGGMESNFSYFLAISLLIIPSAMTDSRNISYEQL